MIHAIKTLLPHSSILDIQKETFRRHRADKRSDSDLMPPLTQKLEKLYYWGLRLSISQEAGDDLLQIYTTLCNFAIR